ncbi:MAG: plasmid replication initiator TrfA [Planctomycetota bacterium]
MKRKKNNSPLNAEVIPLFGRDEMNLIEFPLGPITPGDTKTFEVEHSVFDRKLKRDAKRKLLISGSAAFGLPKPIDDQVLMGMNLLTYEAGFQSKRVEFSRYRLCKVLGWPTDGRAYKRLEESFDRLAGATLKFKDSWWDHGESVWTSKTFHLIDEVNLCSRDEIDRARMRRGSAATTLCSFIWSDVIWKSFADGYIKKIDMTMWRRIGSRRRKDVALRLYRILDKRFYLKAHVSFDIRKLCVGTLGVSHGYAPSQMKRIVENASQWLVECGFLREIRFKIGANGNAEAVFIKAHPREREARGPSKPSSVAPASEALRYYASLSVQKQAVLLEKALEHRKQNHPKLVDGYHRHEKQQGDVFESYREQVIGVFLVYRKTQKAKAA